jgi:hypothetical protein
MGKRLMRRAVETVTGRMLSKLFRSQQVSM